MSPTHPAIDRLAAIGSEELSIAQVAEEVLLKSRAFVAALIAGGKLAALKEQAGAGKKKGTEALIRGPRHTYTITAADVLFYLVNSTEGDRSFILAAIAQRFPHHLHLFTPKPEPAPVPRLKTWTPPAPKQPAPAGVQLDLFA